MKIQGYSDAQEVARLVGSRLFGSGGFSFTLICVAFGHNSLDNWYSIRFSKRVRPCLQNCLERDVCDERGFVYA